jgi:hypothetical protein
MENGASQFSEMGVCFWLRFETQGRLAACHLWWCQDGILLHTWCRLRPSLIVIARTPAFALSAQGPDCLSRGAEQLLTVTLKAKRFALATCWPFSFSLGTSPP